MFYAAPEEESTWSMHGVEQIEADMTLFRNDTKQMVYIGGTFCFIITPRFRINNAIWGNFQMIVIYTGEKHCHREK